MLINEHIVNHELFVQTIKTRELTAREIGEYESRDFLGDETWKRWKTELDNLLAFRKTIKSKPDDTIRFILDRNQESIDFYNSILFHSANLAKSGRCDCRRCGLSRTTKHTK